MDRRQLLFIVLLNTLISLVVAIVVVWLAEIRRPDLEALAASYTPPPPVVLVATPTAETSINEPSVVVTSVQQTDVQPTATPATATAVSGEEEVYVVQEGDSLFAIALRYNLTVDQLLAANNLTNPDFVFSGQRLVIPANGQTGTTDSSEQPATNPGSELALQVEQPNNLAEERVLIVNDSNSAVNLQGWSLGSANGPVYAFGDLPLFPGGSVSVHSESGQDDSLNLYWSQSSPVWSSGSVVRLFNQDGREVVSYTVP